MFVQFAGAAYTPPPGGSTRPCRTSDVMGYYDGNTVTALWNYAQHYALNDNSYGTTFGPSTPGAINLVSGNTHGTTLADGAATRSHNGTIIGDPDPAYDDCSGTDTANMTGTNVGELLNRHGVTWGWFQGGFKPTSRVGGKAVCGSSHTNIGGVVGLRLQPPPRAVPVLQGDGEPAPPAAVVGGDDRPHRPGQAPVRPEQLLGRREPRQPARGQLPQACEVPGRPRRLLRSAGRAALHRADDQPAAAAALVAVDGRS